MGLVARGEEWTPSEAWKRSLIDDVIGPEMSSLEAPSSRSGQARAAGPRPCSESPDS